MISLNSQGWLISDLHDRNIMRDREGNPTIIDALIGPIPPTALRKLAWLRNAVEDAEDVRCGREPRKRMQFVVGAHRVRLHVLSGELSAHGRVVIRGWQTERRSSGVTFFSSSSRSRVLTSWLGYSPPFSLRERDFSPQPRRPESWSCEKERRSRKARITESASRPM